jgi:protein-L-isoaspartate(D-aspartate) O-methyltransferase
MNTAYVREQMVSHQLRTSDVLDDRVLDAVRSLDREIFVPEAWREVAYADIQIPLGHGQHMLTPRIAGRILQALLVKPGERVLEIGTGSGYLTACLARLGGDVTSIDIVEQFTLDARRHLNAAGLAGPRLVHGDALALASSAETYDAIAITASLPVYDARFEAQLKPGGRLFVVVGEGDAMEARLISRTADGQRTQTGLFETRLDPLRNAVRIEAFRF